MKIILNNNEKEISAQKITIVIGDVEFDIRVNKQGELVINKGQFGEGESCLIIKPYQTNEILLT